MIDFIAVDKKVSKGS